MLRSTLALATLALALPTGALAQDTPPTEEARAEREITAILQHVREEHLAARTFLVVLTEDADNATVRPALRAATLSVGASRLVLPDEGTGSRCETPGRRCRVDGAESVVRLLSLGHEGDAVVADVFIGHSVDGPLGPSVRGSARRLTLRQIEPSGRYDVVSDRVLFVS